MAAPAAAAFAPRRLLPRVLVDVERPVPVLVEGIHHPAREHLA